MQDPLGKALLYFLDTGEEASIKVHSSLTRNEELLASHFFRDFETMPAWEQLALNLCQGRVLDLGAGAGCHSLWLQEKGLDITAIDSSPGAIVVMKERGIKDVRFANALTWSDTPYDTLLMLMNGIGITGSLAGLDRFFDHLPKLLPKGGQLIMDSSDIIYMFEEGDGSLWVDLHSEYYGEIQYQMIYGDQEGEWFDWLYIDYDRLQSLATQHGFTCEKLLESDHYNYLAKISL